MQKTAMQELIEWVDSEILLNPEYDGSPRLKMGAMIVKEKAIRLIETEKKQLISAADTMYRNGLSKYPITADEYFEENFGT